MNKYLFTLTSLCTSLLCSFLFVGVATAQPVYNVTITNITQNQSFTPILVASHRSTVSLFTLGQPASTELSTLAEEGNTAPLTTLLTSNDDVVDVQSGEGLLAPGASVTIQVSAARARRLSVAAMLIPTNDAFFALNNIVAPNRRSRGSTVLFARAYDAGSEVNDELCASIPGPSFTECGGAGGGAAPTGGEEGFVHVHNGIHGIGDIQASTRDWRDVVARVEITRTR